LHWLTVGAVRARAYAALMLLVTETVQVTSGGAASLADPLHWVTLVTKFRELVVNVPLPGAQGVREHCRRTVTLELVRPLALMVLTTVTVHVMPVVAPGGPALRLLHCLTVTFAARAGAVDKVSPASENPLATTTTASRTRQAFCQVEIDGSAATADDMGGHGLSGRRVKPQLGNRARGVLLVVE
jgi:hypothetical protein